MAGGAAASAPSKERQAVQLLKRPSPGFRERHRDKGREKTAVKEKEGEVDVEKDASKRGFANKMSGMLAAASSSLRSGPAKKERGSAVRCGPSPALLLGLHKTLDKSLLMLLCWSHNPSMLKMATTLSRPPDLMFL